jgi:hypothetical protein
MHHATAPMRAEPTEKCMKCFHFMPKKNTNKVARFELNTKIYQQSAFMPSLAQ